MKKYTITDKEWESVLDKVQTLEKENQRLTGVIEGMEKAFSLYGVVKSLKDKETMPFDVWFDKNVVESKDGKYFVDGERLRFYELVSKHKTECSLDL